METESIPRYMRIAMSIASRIADGEFQENTRISGRSTLSSEYQVSPETVRKALNLLADMDIVRTVEGSGTIVLSAEKAEKYLETVSVRGEQSDLHSRLQGLLREYTRISRQIYDVGARLIAAGTSPLPSEKTLPNYEVRVPDDSDKIGMSIGDLRFWQCTGATIVAVRRGQSVTVSPGPYLELRAVDVLAVFALIAGTATTFSVATPLLANCITALLGGQHEQPADRIHHRRLSHRPGDHPDHRRLHQGCEGLSAGMTRESSLPQKTRPPSGRFFICGHSPLFLADTSSPFSSSLKLF